MAGHIDRDTLAVNLAAVREKVDAACVAAGRDPSGVRVLPVSKTFDAAAVRAAYELGERRFGENRVQEVRDKAQELADCDLQWVIIGPLQTNKAKDVARLAHEVQTLDRLELAEALDHRLQHEGRAIDALVQVKTSPGVAALRHAARARVDDHRNPHRRPRRGAPLLPPIARIA